VNLTSGEIGFGGANDVGMAPGTGSYFTNYSQRSKSSSANKAWLWESFKVSIFIELKFLRVKSWP